MADLERGLRVKGLREAAHLTQEAIADELGVTLRGYQEWEAGGGIKWDNAKKLAKFHDVDTEFLMNGPRDETPDLLGAHDGSQLDRLEKQVTDLTAAVNELVNRLEPEPEARRVSEAVRRAAAEPSRTPAEPRRKPRAKTNR